MTITVLYLFLSYVFVLAYCLSHVANEYIFVTKKQAKKKPENVWRVRKYYLKENAIMPCVVSGVVIMGWM